ncbi:hypothetical protein H9P43_005445 [Blastocladiella emersonii ATCC 22665]|nr:hypothetical protein H9P43_005445 [Blastocladiella emersonii ATCC 22665]
MDHRRHHHHDYDAGPLPPDRGPHAARPSAPLTGTGAAASLTPHEWTPNANANAATERGGSGGGSGSVGAADRAPPSALHAAEPGRRPLDHGRRADQAFAARHEHGGAAAYGSANAPGHHGPPAAADDDYYTMHPPRPPPQPELDQYAHSHSHSRADARRQRPAAAGRSVDHPAITAGAPEYGSPPDLAPAGPNLGGDEWHHAHAHAPPPPRWEPGSEYDPQHHHHPAPPDQRSLPRSSRHLGATLPDQYPLPPPPPRRSAAPRSHAPGHEHEHASHHWDAPPHHGEAQPYGYDGGDYYHLRPDASSAFPPHGPPPPPRPPHGDPSRHHHGAPWDHAGPPPFYQPGYAPPPPPPHLVPYHHHHHPPPPPAPQPYHGAATWPPAPPALPREGRDRPGRADAWRPDYHHHAAADHRRPRSPRYSGHTLVPPPPPPPAGYASSHRRRPRDEAEHEVSPYPHAAPEFEFAFGRAGADQSDRVSHRDLPVAVAGRRGDSAGATSSSAPAAAPFSAGSAGSHRGSRAAAAGPAPTPTTAPAAVAPAADNGGDEDDDQAPGASSARPRREFFVFDRERYRLMEASLRTPSTPSFPAGLTRKRWRRIMSYLELRPENPPRRTLTWKGCQLWLAPAEDWRDIIVREFHLPPGVAAADPAGADPALMPQHRTFTQTLKLVARRYQTRRSRAGIPLEFVEQVCHECPCYARMMAAEAAIAAGVAAAEDEEDAAEEELSDDE